MEFTFQLFLVLIATSFFCLDVLRELLRGQIESRATVKEMRGEIEHLHYICSRNARGPGVTDDVEVAVDRIERLTQYIPCSARDDLTSLERKLSDLNFFKHAVRKEATSELFCLEVFVHGV